MFVSFLRSRLGMIAAAAAVTSPLVQVAVNASAQESSPTLPQLPAGIPSETDVLLNLLTDGGSALGGLVALLALLAYLWKHQVVPELVRTREAQEKARSEDLHERKAIMQLMMDERSKSEQATREMIMLQMVAAREQVGHLKEQITTLIEEIRRERDAGRERELAMARDQGRRLSAPTGGSRTDTSS
jgi:E3 ubiquitin-protein ligase DOA10